MTSHKTDVEVLGPWSLATSQAFWEGFTPAALPARPARGAEQIQTVFRVEADWSLAAVTVTSMAAALASP